MSKTDKASFTPAGLVQVLLYLALFAIIIIVSDLLFYFLSESGHAVPSSVGLAIELLVGWTIVLLILAKHGFIGRSSYRWDRIAFINSVLILIIGFGFSLTLLGLMTWIPFDPPKSFVAYSETVRQNSILPIVLASLIIAPIAEETFFRGFVFRQWRLKYGFGTALVGSSLLFGLAHIFSWKILIAIPAGFLLGFLYQRLNNILPVIAGHLGINLAAILTDLVLEIFGYSPEEIQHIPVDVIVPSAIMCGVSYAILHLVLGRQLRKKARTIGT